MAGEQPVTCQARDVWQQPKRSGDRPQQVEPPDDSKGIRKRPLPPELLPFPPARGGLGMAPHIQSTEPRGSGHSYTQDLSTDMGVIANSNGEDRVV